jgi:hypothetical protein
MSRPSFPLEHEGEQLLPDPMVAQRYAVHPRTLPRWDQDPALGFPPPIWIRDRKYRRVSELEKWERARAAQSRTTVADNRPPPKVTAT